MPGDLVVARNVTAVFSTCGGWSVNAYRGQVGFVLAVTGDLWITLFTRGNVGTAWSEDWVSPG